MSWLQPLVCRAPWSAGLALVATSLIPAAVHADVWSSYAMISDTMGVSDSRICIGESSRGDIGCPSYAPSVSSTGTLNVTAGLVVDSVSLSTAGTTWGYLGSGASYLPTLSADTVSASTVQAPMFLAIGQAGGAGVSVTASGGAGALSELSDVTLGTPVSGELLTYNGSAWVNSAPAVTDASKLISGTFEVIANTTGYVSLSTASTTWGYLGSGGSYLPVLTANTVSASGVSGSLIEGAMFRAVAQSGSAGVSVTIPASDAQGDRIVSGTSSLIANENGALVANTSMEVATTIKLGDGSSAVCDMSNIGAIRQVNGRFYVCRE